MFRLCLSHIQGCRAAKCQSVHSGCRNNAFIQIILVVVSYNKYLLFHSNFNKSRKQTLYILVDILEYWYICVIRTAHKFVSNLVIFNFKLLKYICNIYNLFFTVRNKGRACMDARTPHDLRPCLHLLSNKHQRVHCVLQSSKIGHHLVKPTNRQSD